MEVDFEDGSEGDLNSVSSGQLSEEDECHAQLMVFYPNKHAVPYKLHCGVNVIGRQSSFAQRDANRLHAWSAEYHGSNVHGVFLESSSVSSAHAVISVEDKGRSCYVEDLKSRNKTFIKKTNRHMAIEPGKRVPLQDSASLTFGALKCRIILENVRHEGQSDMASTDRSQGRPLTSRSSSRAVSIGQRTIPPVNTAGRPLFLDKCPSLQEWFQHPAMAPGQESSSMNPILSALTPAGDEKGDLPQRHSFGFGVVDQDDHTSSDGEPETPRIDRPALRTAARSPVTPFNTERPPLESMQEDDRENQHSPETATNALAESTSTPKAGDDEGFSEEMGAEALTQLRSMSPSLPAQPAEQGFSVQPPIRSSFEMTDEEADLIGGRPRRSRQKSPTMKRSRSGRIASPDKTQPRSKSPRLQRLKDSPEDSSQVKQQQQKLDDIRVAMQDLLAPGFHQN